jgi:hypothetical protein
MTKDLGTENFLKVRRATTTGTGKVETKTPFPFLGKEKISKNTQKFRAKVFVDFLVPVSLFKGDLFLRKVFGFAKLLFARKVLVLAETG